MIKIKHLVLVLLALLSLQVWADPITREEAQKQAQAFLSNAKGSQMLAPVLNQRKLAPRKGASANSATLPYYVFNRGNQQGYIIVSGDDQTLPIIGYTDNGEFDYATLPDNMRHWLDMREKELLDLQQSTQTTVRKKLPQHNAISALVTTKWNQGWPYNNECPMYFNLGRSVTGCVATAMAQVLYFQRSKSVTEIQADIPAYTTYTSHETLGQLPVEGIPSGSPIDWDKMLDTYSSSSSASSQLAVAQLMHYCGVAVKMDYTNSSSGAQSYEVPGAFQKYFGYGDNTRIVYQSSYSDDDWDNLLYNELAEGRPMYLSGYNESGGHAFVCDGYDGNYCFHINWGWGGSSDGYYMLSKLNPGSQGIGGSDGGYSEGEAAVIGCEPENYLERAMPISNATVKKLCVAAWDTNGDGVFSFGEAAAVTDLGNTFKGKTAITTFTELYNFTGLKHISDSAFYGCTRLTTVKLPKKLQSIGKYTFENCKALKSIDLPNGVVAIGEGAFYGCRALASVQVPDGISRIEDKTFETCQALTSIELPNSIQYVGTNAFKGCSKLTSVSVMSIAPQRIVMGENVFEEIDLAAATLNIQQGLKAHFASTPQWQDFGTILETRTLSQGKFAQFAEKTDFFLYNVATGRYLTKGEAYGTQAVVANTDSPMLFQFRRTTSMAENNYYLYSEDTGSTKHILFRTNTDTSVGNGVNACFVDGTLSAKAYWLVKAVDGTDNVFTLQIPSSQAEYSANEYLGVVPTHESNATQPTYGIYSDINYTEHPMACQWMLVAYDTEALKNFQAANELKNLMEIGKRQSANISAELIVYNNIDATTAELERASRQLRAKLSFINFTDPAVRLVAVNNYDTDANNEISLKEAAAVETIDTEFTGNTDIREFPELQYFTRAEYLSGTSFKNCTSLESVVLPEPLSAIYYQSFYGCTKLKSVTIGSKITNISNNAFTNCKALEEVRIGVHNPADITVASNAFLGASVSSAVLYVPQGSKALYEADENWNKFGEIREMRAVAEPTYTDAVVNTDFYVLNLAQKKYINRGEAYGTQAVVASSPVVYQLRRTSTMPEDTYYLYASQESGEGKILFRTAKDSKVGLGIKACFADGKSVTADAYWKLARVDGKENVYTLQVPSTSTDYVEGEYLGTLLSHDTDAVSSYSSTFGLYWDINYSENPLNCQWVFISIEEIAKAEAFFNMTETLKKLLFYAHTAEIECEQEQAVYDNFQSTEVEIGQAIISLRQKLHYIDFVDERAKALCTNRWDINEDGELSIEEAAKVTDISNAFRYASAVKSLDELKYFTSLTSIPDEAFKNSTSLVSLYVPQGVTEIGENAFQTCSALKYIALLNEQAPVQAANSAVTASRVQLFVPSSQIENYQADAFWASAKTVEYTGTPTVKADPQERTYGRSNPKLTYSVLGAPINGEPQLGVETVLTTPVGEYPISVDCGTITTSDVHYYWGTITILPSELTLTAKSYTRNIGEENPTFEYTYTSLRNREKIDEILLQQPVIQCDATSESPAGTYAIRISGAEAQNYDISFVDGVLTVVDPTGINGVQADRNTTELYDLSGRKANHSAKRGIYITNQRRKVVK